MITLNGNAHMALAAHREMGLAAIIPTVGVLRLDALGMDALPAMRDRMNVAGIHQSNWHPIYLNGSTGETCEPLGDLSKPASQRRYNNFGSLTIESTDEGLDRFCRLGIVRRRYRCKETS